MIRPMLRRALAAGGVLLAALGPRGAAGQADEYTIGVGDVLDVRVWQRDDLSRQVTVDVDGRITLPLVGAIRAAGQTALRLGEELTRRYSFVDRQVSQVTVTVLQYNSRRVFVLGAVITPGPYAFAEPPSVWDLIREAGGPTPDAILSRVRVVPPEGEGRPQIVDVGRALATGDFSALPRLLPGSTVLVPRALVPGAEGDVVYVYGRVRQPGMVPIDQAPTVLAAVLAAGGPLDDADMSSVRVVRPGPVRARVFDVDLEDYTYEGVLFPNVRLLPGDTVTVPRSRAQLVLRGFRGLIDASGRVLGTLFFFVRWDDWNDNRRTVVVQQTGGDAGTTTDTGDTGGANGGASP